MPDDPTTEGAAPPTAAPTDPIDEVLAGLRSRRAEEPPPTPPAAATPATPAPPAPAAGEPEKEPVPAEPPPVSPRLLEAAAKRKEQRREVERIEKQYKEKIAELEAKVAGVGKPADAPKPDLMTLATTDPAEFYRHLGYKPIDVARMIAAAEMPDKATEATRLMQRQMKDSTSAMSEVEKLRAEIESLKQDRVKESEQAQADRAIAELRGAQHSYLADDAFLQSGEGQLTLLRKLATSQPARAKSLMWEVTTRYASEYPQDPIPEPEQVAEMVEEWLSQWSDLYQPPAPATQTPSEPQPKPTQSPSISSDLAGRAAADDLPDDPGALEERLAAELRRRKQQA